MADLKLAARKTALIIQDLQNDVIAEGGAFAQSGAPAHARKQKVVENVRALADAFRKAGAPVIHVHYIVEPGAPGLACFEARGLRRLHGGTLDGVVAATRAVLRRPARIGAGPSRFCALAGASRARARRADC